MSEQDSQTEQTPLHGWKPRLTKDIPAAAESGRLLILSGNGTGGSYDRGGRKHRGSENRVLVRFAAQGTSYDIGDFNDRPALTSSLFRKERLVKRQDNRFFARQP
jgi:hypothetical protein